VPVLGINFGTLGYLAEFRVEEMIPTLEGIIGDGHYCLDRRVMLTAEIYRGGEQLLCNRVLNDVVISKSALARIIEIETHLNGLFVNTFRADGLIVSTPTGSTAYNLSAGGPVIYPSMNAVVITPICPHTLSNRPIVLSDCGEVAIEIVAGRDASASFDQQSLACLLHGDRITVRRSEHQMRFLHPLGWSYFDTLRKKLHWNEGNA